ncbi:MAG: urease accessory protein [Betaproteobacteria bacterium]|nr:urease accessory protein [Betaproteobacteria bacterium]
MNAPEFGRPPSLGLDTAGDVASASSGWHARLDLAFAERGNATIPVVRSHRGPLRVQKGFTPEGPGLWHQVVVHPPGGIASGDQLAMAIDAREGARALMTSPGAAKWYRANAEAVDRRAWQSISLSVADRASLEWLPLETIVFDGAVADWRTRIDLQGSGSVIAADLVCLGRPASDLRFASGEIRSQLEITHDGRLIFFEQAHIEGDSPILSAQAGLAGLPAFATMVIASNTGGHSVIIERIRALHEQLPGDWAVSALPGLVVLRWRGPGAEAGWRVLRAAWAACRPIVIGREACPPRIWAT